MRYRLVRDDYFQYLLQRDLEERRYLEQGVSDLIKSKVTGYGRTLKSILDSQITASKTQLRGLSKSELLSWDMIRRIDKAGNDSLINKSVHITDYLQYAYSSGKTAAFKEMSVKSFRGLADQHALNFINNYNFDLITNLSHDLREEIRQVIWIGIQQGQDVHTVESELNKLVIEPLNIISKTTGETTRILSPEARAQMIARTELQRSLNQGRLIAYKNYNVEKINIILGDRACEDCQEDADGGPYSPDDVPVKPSHPNCECDYESADEPSDSPDDPNDYYNLVLGDMVEVTR